MQASMPRRLLWVSLVVVLMLVLLRCQPIPNQYSSLQTQTLAQIRRSPGDFDSAAVLGLALGGGGVRGFVHLGVFKALEEAGIRASVVVGSSAGSIAAALYASGKSYAEIERAVFHLSEWQLIDPVISRQGLVNGRALAAWINDFVDEVPVESLSVRTGITVTDLQRGEPVLITAGNTGHAVQASSSIPGVFVPVQANGHTFSDGGALALIPVHFASALGADTVLAVDVYCGAAQPIEENLVNTLLAVFRLQSCEIARAEAALADILISPEFEPESFRSFSSRDAAIAAGYASTQNVIPKLRQLMNTASQ